MSRHYVIIPVVFLALLAVVLAVNFLAIRYNGTSVPVPAIPRGPENFGSGGNALTYVVLGDSTSVGQGGDYDQGIARATARYIARDTIVTMHNLGVSGARAADVAGQQASAAARLQPDIVLIAVCANDVTHLTPIPEVRSSLESAITTLRSANPAVRIILTGSPQMGSVPRFVQPAKALARHRTGRMNTMVTEAASTKQVTFAPIAAETGPIFDEHPEYFASDKFHPSTTGYNTWVPVLQKAIDRSAPEVGKP
ncbi:MAG TPA: SGNH/GDSL hydrolase family protein [Candidatus Saccharimonadales bacterium]|jgi:lysophospholipase L1-like esterase